MHKPKQPNPPQKLNNRQIIEMRRAGFTIREISERSGLAEGTVGSRLRRWNVKPEFPVTVKPRVDESVFKELHHLYWEREMSICEIAELQGFHETTIGHRMHLGGIPRRSVSDGQKMAWRRGRQSRGPRGFVLNRLNRRLEQVE